MRPEEEGRQLLSVAETSINSFMWLPNEHLGFLGAAWAIHASLWTREGEFLPYASPRLYIGSIEAGAGKTTLADIILAMCHGERMSGPSAFALTTAINNSRTPIGLDEVDRHFGNRGQTKQDQHIIINEGYLKGSKVPRQRNDEIMMLNCHGPMILIGKNWNRFMNGEQWETARTRSIHFQLAEAPDDAEVIEFEGEFHFPRLIDIGTRMRKWGMRNGRAITRLNVDDILPVGLGKGRKKQIWKIMFQIAKFLGPAVVARMTRACNAIALGIWEDDEEKPLSSEEELLVEVRAIFDEDEEFLSTTEIIKRIMKAPGETWWKTEWRNPRAASMGLSQYLGMFGIEKQKPSINGEQVRGYFRADVYRPVDNLDNLDNQTTKTTCVDVDQWDFSEIE